ncbi:hypothetical protein jhhlp_007087 [Lomentospora prolificans]|uniref:ubiquitinyl hydrolase 1 n=1 Tax=Lomentospora prolificans TaxID=41688 RepID=A0A2N3N1N1_9PEZI|nr:hypothetical protein jhhlp_007087 [Lomentospora prolificans]
MSFFNKFKGANAGTSAPGAKEAAGKKKEEPAPELTPLEKMLQNAGPLRNDGTDKFFGLENVKGKIKGETNECVPAVWQYMMRAARNSYCNSIVQSLYYSEAFRNHVVNYPSVEEYANGVRPKVNVTIRPPMVNTATQPPNKDANKRRQISGGNPPGQPGVRPEDKPDSPEYKKKQAMMKGPILELSHENATAYGMEECTFTGLKDIFLALLESQTRTGVLSPQRFLEIFKRDNEMFRNSMHQDAHEFYGLVLNDVISNVEANAKRTRERDLAQQKATLAQSTELAINASNAAANAKLSSTGWVHDIFEGVLTSETKCLTCETTSQRDETFLDLSIDLEEHASVTSCLGKFSAEEMLCERNKFHCDHCGGLQEAEKRMKIHKLPKVLAFHLKRFKYTEDYSRLQKLFHRVVYPYHLRLFNTTDDAEDPDRLYELYAVVVHIGGNAYHGHYVSVIKTKDRGWLLFDDEMVEPVDKHFVKNFFGDKPGMACAYVLFYQETTFEKMRAEQDAEGFDDLIISNDKAACDMSVQENGLANGVNGVHAAQQESQADSTEIDRDLMPKLAHAHTEPIRLASSEAISSPVVPQTPATPPPKLELAKTKEDLKRERKEAEAAEKAAERARKAAAKLEEKQRKEARERLKAEQDDLRKAMELSKIEEKKGNSFLSRSARGSKSMSKKSFAFLGKDKEAGESSSTLQGDLLTNGDSSPAPLTQSHTHEKPDKFKDRFTFGIGRKKSSNVLS